MKKVVSVEPSPPGHWVGDGFPVRTVISPGGAGKRLSPFLLLDYAGPAEFPPTDKPRGVDEHPHRGFETVTIVYQGEIEHRDSAGNRGRIGPGDVQWMTAASGVVHEEKHAAEFSRRGGAFEVIQLWVNLPAKDKMSPPRYQELLAGQIPTVDFDGGAVRVIAGRFRGVAGPARTFTPIQVWDVRLKAGHRAELEVPGGLNAALFVLSGAVVVNASDPVGAAELAVFEREGEAVAVEAREDAKLLVLAGEPIDEPVVAHGPFVMNTPEEIRRAIADYQGGRMGALGR